MSEENKEVRTCTSGNVSERVRSSTAVQLTNTTEEKKNKAKSLTSITFQISPEVKYNLKKMCNEMKINTSDYIRMLIISDIDKYYTRKERINEIIASEVTLKEKLKELNKENLAKEKPLLYQKYLHEQVENQKVK